MDLDGPELDSVRRRAKTLLRQRMRALREAIPEAALAERNRAIVLTLGELPELRGASHIALFWPMPARREVDLRPLDAALRARGAAVFYPFMTRTSGASIGFCRVLDPATQLSDRGRGFLEPDEAARVGSKGDVDVVVVPALAVSPDGHRLGYGSGFYDALLPEFRPPAIAVVVAFDFQLLSELPTDDHDVPCDVVVTDKRTVRVGGRLATGAH